MKNTKKAELAIVGLETVKALAKMRPNSIQRFFYNETCSRKFGELFALMAKQKKAYRLVTDKDLETLSGTTHHQGVVAMVEDLPIPYVSDEQIEKWSKSNSRIVVLDNVGDDHNIGSIARSAAFFSWDAIILSDDEQNARLTTSTYRVARGALEFIPVYREKNAECFITKANKKNILTIAADHRAKLGLKEFANKTNNKLALSIVLGNEETGLKKATLNSCTEHIKIFGNGSIESLNVSQAAAVMLYALKN